MPDPHVPDHLIETLRAENRRLVHENHDLTARIAECNDHKAQFARSLTQAVDENRALRRRLGES